MRMDSWNCPCPRELDPGLPHLWWWNKHTDTMPGHFGARSQCRWIGLPWGGAPGNLLIVPTAFTHFGTLPPTALTHFDGARAVAFYYRGLVSSEMELYTTHVHGVL